MINGNIDRNEIIESYKRALEETSKFAAGKVKVDDKGNITLEKTRVSQLENEKSESSKDNEGFEIDD